MPERNTPQKTLESIFGFRSDRSRGRFFLSVLSILVLHCVALLLIRTVFPFRSILTIIPIALGECIVLAALMLKILGDDEAVRTA